MDEKPNFEFSLFVFANVVFPGFIIMVLNLGLFNHAATRSLMIGTVGAIFFIHVYLLRNIKQYRVAVGTVMILNLLAFVLVGGLNSVTAIPELPYFVKNVEQLLK